MSIFRKSNDQEPEDVVASSIADEVSNISAVDGSDVVAPDAVTSQESPQQKSLPFAFAKRNGVLAKAVHEGEAIVLRRPGT